MAKNISKSDTDYGALLADALPGIIETETENNRCLRIVERLMDKRESLTKAEGRLLTLMAYLIQEFETRHYKPQQSKPCDILRELMVNRGLRQKDMVPLLGQPSRVSEILSGKRGISKTQAKSLAAYFRVSVDVFL